LSGTLPAAFGNLDLSYLSLANNQLTGTIPNTWGTIGLAYNQLRGSLKPLGNMRALKVDFLRNNNPGFQGHVPALPKK
jgi:hypothetical protein